MSRALTADAELTRIVGDAAITPGGHVDAILGVRPDFVVAPETPEAVAEVLARCSTAGLSVVVRGGGSRLEWGRPPRPVNVVLSTRRLTRIVRYEPGDLTVGVDHERDVATLPWRTDRCIR